MQIVIDIDDNLYTRLFDNGENYVADMRRACVAIRNGTPLPKCHGRLIDADKLISSFSNYNGVSDVAKTIDSAPTIIEAESGE